MNARLPIAMHAFIHKKATPINGAWSYEPLGHTKYEGKHTMGERQAQFKGDCRGFGEPGTSRLSWTLDVPLDALGSLHTRKPYEKWMTSHVGASHRRWRRRSGDIMQGMGPWTPWVEEKLTATDRSEIVEVGASHVEVTGEAGYPFDPLMAPDIDFSLRASFKGTPTGQLEVRLTGSHNLFPFYEIIVNGSVVWKHSPRDAGPSLLNLNLSQEFDETVTI